MISSKKTFPRKVGGYALPNLYDSEDDWRRLYNRDLSGMTLEELRVELARVNHAYNFAFGSSMCVRTADISTFMEAAAWLRGRARAIEIEVRSRPKQRAS